MGCHTSKKEATAQLAALHIAEADRGANEEITLREQVADMEIREEGNAMYPLNERQTMQYGLLEALVESYGKFDQSSGANGAHYMAEQPFMAEGMQCSNCVFYEGPRGCELVHGDIDPGAICKLWVIPESLIPGVMPNEPADMMIEEPTDMAEDPMPEMPAQRESVLPVYWRMLQLRDATNTIKLPQPEITGTYSAVDVEERLVQGRTFEVRATPTSIASASVDPSLPLTFRGYAAVFNSASQPLPFIETIRPGAFKRSLQSGKEIRMYLNHNSDQVLASTRSGTLRLTEDTRGLMVEADLPPTSYGKDISILMQRGDVHSMSFGFTIPTNGDSWSSDGRSRELREIILHEVSIVTGFPAYEGTAGATITD
jgi:HK97 family phage prohead protease